MRFPTIKTCLNYLGVIALVSSCLTTTAMSISPEAKLYQSLSQLSVSAEKEPSMGAIRSDKNQTDIRSVFQGPDGKETVVNIWSPRVHPFKEPPSYAKIRPCLFGEYFETTIGVRDITKSHILRQSGREQKYPNAFEWNDKELSLNPLTPPTSPPQEVEFLGKVFEFEKTGACNYHPREKLESEDARIYFFKHLEIARKANATDIIFPKTTFSFINSRAVQHLSFDYELPINSLSDMRLEFNGSTFLFPPNHGGVIFHKSQRVVFSGAILEWAKPGTDKNPEYSGPIVHGIYSPRDNNSDLWFENMTLRRVPGWGFYFDSTRGVLISDSKISSVSGDNIPATREGAIHGNNVQNIIIRNNVFSNLGKNAIDLHGQYALVTTPVFSPKNASLESGFSNCVGMGSYWRPYSAGETLAFFNSKMDFQGEIKLRTVETFSSADPSMPEYCKGFSHCSRVCFGAHPEFKPEQFGFTTSVSQNSALFIIHGNTLSQIQGRGIQIQGSNGVISENIISQSEGPGIELGANLAEQMQGPGAFNILLKNNELQRVAIGQNFLSPSEPLFGGIALGALRKELDGRKTFLKTPLVQNIRIEGTRSSVEDAGSVALQIASSHNIDVRSLSVGAAGIMRNLSSGSLAGGPAEGSVLLTYCSKVDLAGLTTPPLLDNSDSRNRTIVIDGQHVAHLRVPLITKSVFKKTAHTRWNLTFRSYFKENLTLKQEAIEFVLESPALSTYLKNPPVAAFTILTPKVGDKEIPQLGRVVPLNTTSTRWTLSMDHSLQSPNRIQLRPTLKKSPYDLFLSFDSILMTPKKTAPMPFES
ncbi:MAG: right-handed parallel beta-helix repeat-containing protein [Deltaproteobacteria bacterium]